MAIGERFFDYGPKMGKSIVKEKEYDADFNKDGDKKDIPIFTNKPLKDKFPKYYEKLTTLKEALNIYIKTTKYKLPDEELLKISEKRLKATNHPWFPSFEDYF